MDNKQNDVIILKDTRPAAKPRYRDGRPPAGDEPEVLPFNASAPEPAREKLIIAGSPVGKTFPEGESPQILGLDGAPLEAPPLLTWDEYLAWRKTLCRPFAGEGTEYALNPDMLTGNEEKETAKRRALEEIDQATLEFIGEVAELAELALKHGPMLYFESLRDKLIDECGDIFFCGVWALDAWGKNPFYGADDLEMVRVTDQDGAAIVAQTIATQPMRACLRNPKFVEVLVGTTANLLIAAQTNAGLLANSFKKLKYQRRAQDIDQQVGRVVMTLLYVNQILIMANSSVEEALLANQRKLNARYPAGYQSGQGGGIRVGAGK